MEAHTIPVGIGTILDRSFRLYRNHFAYFGIISLLLIAPFYLLQSVLLHGASFSGMAFVDELRAGGMPMDILQQMALAEEEALNDTGFVVQTMLASFAVLPLLLFVAAPLMLAAVLHYIRSVMQGEPPLSVKESLRLAVSRLWPMAKGTLIYCFSIFGIYFALIFAHLFVGLAIFFAGMQLGLTGSTNVWIIVLTVLVIVCVIGGLLALVSFFAIRWGYYLPFVALGMERTGMTRSWTVTRGSFWRLMLMYTVLIIVLQLFAGAVSLVIVFAAGAGLLAQLLSALVSVLLLPLYMIPYVLSFFDLRVRKEAVVLEQMIRQLAPVPQRRSEDKFPDSVSGGEPGTI